MLSVQKATETGIRLGHHVYVMIEADCVNLYSQILTGDDRRHLEGNGLLQPFTDQILASVEPYAVLSMLRDHGQPTAASS